MKNERKMRAIPVFVVSLCVGLTITIAQSASTRLTQQTGPAVATPSQIAQALREGGLRAAARLVGDYKAAEDVHSRFVRDLPALAKRSPLIVFGRFSDNVCKLSADGQSIRTEYHFTVQRVFRGQVQPDDTISVEVIGGRVEFPDEGTSAEIFTPNFVRPMNGTNILLFLRDSDGDGVWAPTDGPQGMFQIDPQGIVKTYGRDFDRVMAFNNRPKAELMDAVQQAASANAFDPRLCCP